MDNNETAERLKQLLIQQEKAYKQDFNLHSKILPIVERLDNLTQQLKKQISMLPDASTLLSSSSNNNHNMNDNNNRKRPRVVATQSQYNTTNENQNTLHNINTNQNIHHQAVKNSTDNNVMPQQQQQQQQHHNNNNLNMHLGKFNSSQAFSSQQPQQQPYDQIMTPHISQQQQPSLPLQQQPQTSQVFSNNPIMKPSHLFTPNLLNNANHQHYNTNDHFGLVEQQHPQQQNNPIMMDNEVEYKNTLESILQMLSGPYPMNITQGCIELWNVWREHDEVLVLLNCSQQLIPMIVLQLEELLQPSSTFQSCNQFNLQHLRTLYDTIRSSLQPV